MRQFTSKQKETPLVSSERLLSTKLSYEYAAASSCNLSKARKAARHLARALHSPPPSQVKHYILKIWRDSEIDISTQWKRQAPLGTPLARGRRRCG